ncbi:hypothetical protein [Tomitella gaofuii]|uniref:hypothetical protein n=1 Tax=Tomitella gaofuii TaxID=2760083 RepID=UPI0015F8569D|nr:hypothetical protein [Tomitella gaofuii]
MATQHTPSRSGAHLNTAQIKQHLAVMSAAPVEAGGRAATANYDTPLQTSQ